MTTSSPLELLPNEILNNIFVHCRVNDQICLALTTKHFYTSITSHIKLACNSRKDKIRYETWRFAWIKPHLQYDLPLLLNEKLADTSNPARIRAKMHMRRCKRSLRADMVRRMGPSNSNKFRNENLQTRVRAENLEEQSEQIGVNEEVECGSEVFNQSSDAEGAALYVMHDAYRLVRTLTD